jgi:hypothetical protein
LLLAGEEDCPPSEVIRWRPSAIIAPHSAWDQAPTPMKESPETTSVTAATSSVVCTKSVSSEFGKMCRRTSRFRELERARRRRPGGSPARASAQAWQPGHHVAASDDRRAQARTERAASLSARISAGKERPMSAVHQHVVDEPLASAAKVPTITPTPSRRG